MKPRFVMKSIHRMPAGTFALFRAENHPPAGGGAHTCPPAELEQCDKKAAEARQRAAEFTAALLARSKAPLRIVQPWPHGGLND